MQRRLPFVHLRYFSSPDFEAEPGISVLITRNGKALDVAIRPDWKRHVDPKDHDYVESMISDWQRATAVEIPQVIKTIAEMSLGPLRVVESGRVLAEKQSELIKRILAA